MIAASHKWRWLLLPALLLNIGACLNAVGPAWQVHLNDQLLVKQGLSVVLPSAIAGALDSSPSGIGRVRVAPGRNGQVAVAWIRNEDRSKADHEQDLVRIAIINHGGVQYQECIPGIGPASGFSDDILGDLSFQNGRWYLLIALWLHRSYDLSTDGLAILDFDINGQKPFKIMEPGRAVYGISSESAWLYGSSDDGWLFWMDKVPSRWEPPDFMGGRTHWAINAVRLDTGQASKPRQILRPRRTFDDNQMILALGDERFDLLFTTNSLTRRKQNAPADLLHIPNVVGSIHHWPRLIARPRDLSRLVALPLSGQRIHVVWLESLENWDNLNHEQAADVRLMDVYLEKGTWSRPGVVASSEAWRFESLAAAGFELDDREGIFAVWQHAERKTLVYAICLNKAWSAPVESNLAIGRENWLAYCGDGLFCLVTLVDHSLQWCYLSIDRSTPRRM